MPFQEAEMLRRIIVTVLVLAIAGVIVYDSWCYLSAQRNLRDTTYELARWAAENADTLTRDVAAARLAEMGSNDGVVVYQYGQTDEGIQIWTRAPVTDTIVAERLYGLAAGGEKPKAEGTTLTVRDYREAGIQ